MNAKKLRETGEKLLNKDMNKEILNKLLEYFKESNINDFGYEKDKLISYKEAQILLDYISELEEQIENLQIEKEDYKSRCEKAIKWIDKHTEIYTKNGISIIDWDNFSDPRNLKNILNGGDEE